MNRSTINKINIHPAVFMMEQWRLFMDGIDRIIGFYTSGENSVIEGLEWTNKIGQSHTIPFGISETVTNELKDICREKVDFQWQRPDLLPFVNKTSSSINQLDLFSEHQYLVLLVRIPNNYSTLHDVYYLFFRNDQSNFGITDSQTILDTSHKAMIGKMASRFGRMTVSNFKEAKKKEISFKNQTKALLAKRVEQNNVLKVTFTKWKNHWLRNYISKISQRDGVNYVISESLEENLLMSHVSFDVLKDAIDQSVVYICELVDYCIGDDIYLDESMLIIEEQVKTTKKVEELLPVSRINKTMLLLDRLEYAAEDLFNKGMPITSADVGSTMDKPITAPAISDALRKNRTRIFQLFEQYPQRWQVIRSHFRPIINLSSKKKNDISISS